MKYRIRIHPLGWLQLLFLGLRVAGVVEWSWGWVLAPLWVALSASFLYALIFFRR